MYYLGLLLLCLIASVVRAESIQSVTCGPVCEIYCQYGNVLDTKGCPTCSCKKSPCENDRSPLVDYFCGRGLNRRDCPSTHYCKIAPNDAYAVCCPRADPVQKLLARKSTVKRGSCPPPSGLFGICIARCTTDTDCQGDLKCCGGCPRSCVQPVFWNQHESNKETKAFDALNCNYCSVKYFKQVIIRWEWNQR
jgi:hypothetical protein